MNWTDCQLPILWLSNILGDLLEIISFKSDTLVLELSIYYKGFFNLIFDDFGRIFYSIVFSTTIMLWGDQNLDFNLF
jgi:hypothetical protein